MKPSLRQGILALSKKGRDKGRVFVVLYEVDADFVLVCDGELRKLEKPKKKRRKHLQPIGYELGGFGQLLESGRLNNSGVRKAILRAMEEKQLQPTLPTKEGRVFVQK